MCTNRLLILIPAVSMIAASCIRYSQSRVEKVGPDDLRARTAVDAVTRFHTGLSGEQFAELCRASEEHAFSGATQLRCSEYLAYQHQHLGNFKQAKEVKSFSVEIVEPGKPFHVALDCLAVYERGEAREHFEWLLGRRYPILTSYDIDSSALH